MHNENDKKKQRETASQARSDRNGNRGEKSGIGIAAVLTCESFFKMSVK